MWAQKPTYSVTDLGTLPGGYSSSASGINSSGQVVGSTHPAGSNNFHAFLYNGGAMRDLGTLYGSESVAYGINSSGQVVGESSGLHAFLYSGGKMGDLGTLVGNDLGQYVAYGINSSGQVVGETFNSAVVYAFLYSGGKMNALAPPPTLSAALGINDSGQVVGCFYIGTNFHDDPPPYSHAAFLYSGGMSDLGTLGGSSSCASGINNNGQVVGWSQTAGSNNSHAFLYSGGKMSDLGTLGGSGSLAHGINSGGQVVGESYLADNLTRHAFLYGGGTMTDLNSLVSPGLGITLYQATGINDRGQIVANGAGGAYLLTPLLSIDQVTMFDSHTLRVDVSTQFSQNGAAQKTVSIATTPIGADANSPNTIALSPSNCPDCSYTLPSGAVGQFMNSFRIDLTKITGGLPRFTDNQVFTVTATVTEGGAVVGTASKPAEIPLPVVHVHGVLSDCIGDPFPTALFTFLQGQHPYSIDRGTSLHGPQPFTQPYPTLVSYPYGSLTGSTHTFAIDLGAWLRNDLLPATYADKVNVVAHSLGGIVTRDAIWVAGANQTVNKLILVGSPSTGSTLAPVAKNNWAVMKSLGTVLPAALIALIVQVLGPGVTAADIAGEFQDFAKMALCVGIGGPSTTYELFPTYPWFAPNQLSADTNQNLSIPTSYVNPVLPALNTLGLHQDVRYYAVVASGLPTLAKDWGKFYLTDAVQLLLQDPHLYGPGDGIVLLDSQLGDHAWPLGVGKGKLNIVTPTGGLRDAGKVFHTSYLSNPTSQGYISDILWGNQ
jgi:probable HAF family extracellular repeat protein